MQNLQSCLFSFLTLCFFGISLGCSPVHYEGPGQSTFASSSEAQKACEEDLKLQFAKTYHSFLQSNCSSCHAVGGIGNGEFAAIDLDRSYSQFNSKGESLVRSYATSMGHKPPATGPQHSETLQAYKTDWETALNNYDVCVASIAKDCSSSETDCDTSEGELADPRPERLISVDKAVSIGETPQTLVFNLENEMLLPKAEYLGASLSVRVELITPSNNDPIYIRLSRPQLTAGPASALRLKDLRFRVDGELYSFGTTWAAVDRSVPKQEMRSLINTEIPLRISKTSVQTIGLSIERIESVEFDPPTFTELRGANGVLGQNCLGCHSGASARAGYNMANYNGLMTHVIAYDADSSLLHSRMTDSDRPMPTSGLLDESQIQQVRDWINDGALNN